CNNHVDRSRGGQAGRERPGNCQALDSIWKAPFPESRDSAPRGGAGSGGDARRRAGCSPRRVGDDVDGLAPRERGGGGSGLARFPLMLVIDATVAFDAVQGPEGFDVFGNEELVAPWLMWSEARSALHEAIWRREMSPELGRRSFEALEAAPVRPRTHRRLG